MSINHARKLFHFRLQKAQMEDPEALQLFQAFTTIRSILQQEINSGSQRQYLIAAAAPCSRTTQYSCIYMLCCAAARCLMNVTYHGVQGRETGN